MLRDVALWLLVATLWVCAALCWLQARHATRQARRLDLSIRARPDTMLRRRRERWLAWRACCRAYGAGLVVSAMVFAGVALGWW